MAEPTDVQVNLRLPRELLAEVDAAAGQRVLSRGIFLQLLIREALARLKAPEDTVLLRPELPPVVLPSQPFPSPPWTINSGTGTPLPEQPTVTCAVAGSVVGDPKEPTDG